jgi:hypothetical protein
MLKQISGCFLFLWGYLLISSCGQPRLLLKQGVKCDTLHIHLATNTIQQFEYKQAIENKTAHYIQVYNSEQHPFFLLQVDKPEEADCKIDFLKTKFVSSKRSRWATVISTAGIATAAVLISTNFFLPVGWLYIPNARTSIRASLSPSITDQNDFPDVTLSSSGMFRKTPKQIDLQSTKVVKYIIEMVHHLETEYKALGGG